MEESLVQNERRTDYNLRKSYDTFDLEERMQEAENQLEKKSLFKHEEGFLIKKQYQSTLQISKFNYCAYSITSAICFLFITLCVTFDRKLTSNYLTIGIIFPIFTNLLLILDSYYIIYYRRKTWTLYLYNIVGATFWINTYLLLKNGKSPLLVFFSYFHYVVYPLANLITMLIFIKERDEDRWIVVNQHCSPEHVVVDLILSAVFLKIFELGFGPLRGFFVLLPITLLMLCGVGVSVFFFVDYFWNHREDPAMADDPHRPVMNFNSGLLGVNAVLLPCCLYGLICLWNLDNFFRGESGRLMSFLIVTNFWIILVGLIGIVLGGLIK